MATDLSPALYCDLYFFAEATEILLREKCISLVAPFLYHVKSKKAFSAFSIRFEGERPVLCDYCVQRCNRLP